MSDTDFCLDCCELNRDREVKDLKCMRCLVKSKPKPKKGEVQKHPDVAPSHSLLRKDMKAGNAYVDD